MATVPTLVGLKLMWLAHRGIATPFRCGHMRDTARLTTVSLIAVASLVQALVFAAASTTVLERSDTRT